MPFEPYRTEFSAANAAMMAELARAVYLSDDEGAPDAEAILEALQAGDGGFQSVWPFDTRSSQACVVVHEDFICAVFRGTNELADWRTSRRAGRSGTTPAGGIGFATGSGEPPWTWARPGWTPSRTTASASMRRRSGIQRRTQFPGRSQLDASPNRAGSTGKVIPFPGPQGKI